ncbi:general transcription factor II-I repeat domain-containing protein 2A [Trichonephila clavipes]|nr:general transcription factor II-I repeat domain-containing protein 2A [Trichonephila clavipes]
METNLIWQSHRLHIICSVHLHDSRSSIKIFVTLIRMSFLSYVKLRTINSHVAAVLLHEGFWRRNVILNHGQVTWTTPELAPPLLTTTPTNGRTFQLSTDLTCIAALHGGSFSGTGIELMTCLPWLDTLTTGLPQPEAMSAVNKIRSQSTSFVKCGIQHFTALSLAIDESCDIKDTEQVALFVRYMSSQGPKEELLGLLPLSGPTRRDDITNAIQKCLEDNKIDLNKIFSTATDGSRTKLNELNLKLQGKGNPAYVLVEELVCFEELILFAEDILSER